MKGDRKLMQVQTLLLLVLTFLFQLSFKAQTNEGITTAKDAVYGEPGIDILYTNSIGFSAFVHTQGAGLNFRYGKFKTAKSSTSFAFDIFYTKHIKEELTSNPLYSEALPYNFGKINSMFTTRLLIENRKEITPKLRYGAVQVGYLYRYGLNLGFLKPVYLDIGYPDLPYEYTLTEPYNPEEHNYDDIYGRASWINGLDELKVVPGLHGGFGLFFEYGNERGQTNSLEVGTYFDVYLSEMEIISTEFVDANRIFAGFYIKIEMGSNWTDAR